MIVWLLCACGVRRFRGLRRVSPLFYLFCLSFVLFLVLLHLLSLLVLLSSACPLSLLSLSLWVVVVSFSLSVYTQKERALRVWCVLSCPVVVLWVYYMFSAFLSMDSLAFENIHPAPQVR